MHSAVDRTIRTMTMTAGVVGVVVFIVLSLL